jgi:hypothetical protein
VRVGQSGPHGQLLFAARDGERLRSNSAGCIDMPGTTVKRCRMPLQPSRERAQ